MTLLLARVIGVFLIILSVFMILRREWIMSFVEDFGRERAVRLVTAILELIGGLFLVLGFEGDGSAAAIIILVIGWMMLLEGIAYLALPDHVVKSLFRMLNVPSLYVGGGVLALLAGGWLAAYGFGWIG